MKTFEKKIQISSPFLRLEDIQIFSDLALLLLDRNYPDLTKEIK